MNVRTLTRVYFIGAGGIGMSALARYFHEIGAKVSGYDRTPTQLTRQLEAEGIAIHFQDDTAMLDKEAELVVYTPAIPHDHKELNWYRSNGYSVYKRSDVLQWITESLYAITIAGTHGKTTISTLLAFLLRESGFGCNAFLGGIAVNYNTNFWRSDRQLAVIEADEYDRSFLKLSPDIALLTATDPDHLDIYGTAAAMEDAFIQYTHNIKPGGTLLVKKGLKREAELRAPQTLTYSLDDETSDYKAYSIGAENGGHRFTFSGPGLEVKDCFLPMGGLHNVENAVAALAVAHLLHADVALVAGCLPSFLGIKRRFEYVIRNEHQVYIDDYAHHPEELAALIRGARAAFGNRKLTLCFQPHLFTRTRDLAHGFAAALDQADEIVLLDIYPARELPIEGVTAALIMDRMVNRTVQLLTKEAFLDFVKRSDVPLLATAGAGDIDKLVEPIKEILNHKQV